MIIDTHVHFYDPTRPQGVPYPEPDTLLYRTVLPEHYKEVAVPEGVTGVVVTEASDWVEDNQWVLDLMADDPFLVGLIGNLNVYSAEFARNLDRFAANPLFRGIRVRNLAPGAEVEGAMSSLEQLADKDFEMDKGVGELDDYPWLFEVLRRVPRLRVVITHIAEGRPINGKGPPPRWVENIQRMASFPQVFCKVSAIVQMTEIVPAPADVEYYRPQLDALWNAFGEDRLVYASNWPNMTQGAPYALQQNVVATYFGGKSDEALEKFFWKNSKAAYKWVERR